MAGPPQPLVRCLTSLLAMGASLLQQDFGQMTKSYAYCERLSLSISGRGVMIVLSSLDGIDGSNAHLLQVCRSGADGPFDVAFDQALS